MDAWGRFIFHRHFLNMKTRPPFVLYNSSRDDLVDFSLFYCLFKVKQGGPNDLFGIVQNVSHSWTCYEKFGKVISK